VPFRRLRLLWLAVSSFVLLPAASALACDGEQATPSAGSMRLYARSVECLLNEQRASNGLSALGHDRRLARAAGRLSTAMVRERFFAHVSPSGSTPADRARRAGFTGQGLGETIGWGAGALATPAAIVQAWMNSPPHRAIIMGRQFRLVGLGIAGGSPVGAAGAITVTADFGA
jgi:uncharacterized protein YkwD